jgi:hypothetical protein
MLKLTIITFTRKKKRKGGDCAGSGRYLFYYRGQGRLKKEIYNISKCFCFYFLLSTPTQLAARLAAQLIKRNKAAAIKVLLM